MTEDTGLILVVDDNEMNRDMLSRRLRRQKYEVDVAEDGEQALSMVHEKSYDLVLLDIMMPNISGYEVLERIKSDAQIATLPVIMISAVDDLDSVVRCIELGAEDYLFKPFNPVLLKARVGASLARKRANVNAIQPHVSAIDDVVTDMLENSTSDADKGKLLQIKETITEMQKVLGVQE